MKFLPLPALLAAALFSIVISLPSMPFAASRVTFSSFEVTATSSQRGSAQLFYDLGNGIREEDSIHVNVDSGHAGQVLRFGLPAGHYTRLRLDPLDRAATMTLANVVIRDQTGTVVRRFAATDFKAEQQVALLQPAPDGTLHLEIAPGSNDPITYLTLATPFHVSPDYGNIWPSIRRITLPAFAIVVLLLITLRSIPAGARDRARVWITVLTTTPSRAVMLAAALAVVASSYPVVFLGKSFVSPNWSAELSLLYETMPTLPGYREAETANVKGSDIGAVMWSHLPMAAVEARALLHDHELPLWNRDNSCGTVLLGQGQSIFGDPLHFLILAANDAAWAWDVKYLVAKWLLAAGIGLCVLRVTRHLPAAAIVAAIMPFIGFFIYRVNHPAIFSTCYAPWILLCWLGIVTAGHWRGAAMWVGGLLLANWSVMNSGTAKEAYMSLLTLNWAGAVVLACTALPAAERLRRFALAAAGGVIFALLSAPVWLTFLEALAKSYTSYNNPQAFQVQPSLALAFFDEIFFRPYNDNQVYNGSVNFLVLLGVLAFLVNVRRICAADRIALGLALATLLPLVIIFGVIPPQWIVRVPFVGNVAHIENSFFCPTIALLGVLAGYGFRSAAERLGGPEGPGDLAVGSLLLGALVAYYVAFGQAVQRSTSSYWHAGQHIVLTPFVVGSLIALVVAAVGFAFVARRMLASGTTTVASVLTLATCALVLLGRHGLHVKTAVTDYVLSPQVRVDFHASSPAIDALRGDQGGEPWRFVGLGGNAFHGWMNMYNLEGIGGPDPLVNAHYRELQDALGLERIWDWRIYAWFGTLRAQKRAFDFLNVRHYLDYASDQGLLGAILSPVKMADLDVYRSETAWPRAFFTDRLAVYSEAKELGKLVNDGDGRPFAAMQKNDATRPATMLPELTGRSIVAAQHYRLTTNTTAFDINATGPGIVVLSEAWLWKDFRAKLDGKPVPYLRVNHAFKGVMIDAPGAHHVEFEYWPRRFTEALAMAGVGAALLAASLFVVLRRPRVA